MNLIYNLIYCFVFILESKDSKIKIDNNSH